MTRLAILLALLACPAAAETVQDVLDAAKADCASLDNGSFTTAPQAVTKLDLTGDGAPDALVDSTYFQCTTSASYWGGTGGNWLTVLIGDQRFDYLAQAWQAIVWADAPVLLLWHNGGDCGGSGADPCVEALVWSAYQGRFMSVAPSQDD